MELFNLEETKNRLFEQPIIQELGKIHPEFPILGFREGSFKGYIAGFKGITTENLPVYQNIFKGYLGALKKSFNTEARYFMGNQYFTNALNRMNGFLIGGEEIRQGIKTLDQVIDEGIRQQGGCKHLNLFNKQACYGKISSDRTYLEIVRIAPHIKDDLITCEYMLETKQ